MINLLLAIVSSAMVAIMMRVAQPRIRNATGLLAANYIVCTLTALILALPEFAAVSIHNLGSPVGLGALNGFFYLAGFALMQYNTRRNGVVLSSVFMKLGILVSMTLSVVWFQEVPTAVQVIGFVIAIAAIVIINYEKGNRMGTGSWTLLLMLFTAGMGDTMSKAYDTYGDPGLQNAFLLVTFLSALCLCLVMMVKKRERLGLRELGFGVLLGIPNFLCSLFLLRALGSIPAVIAFPVFNVAVILAVTAAGLLLFRERLTKKQMLGCIFICIALVFLNL